MEKLKLYLDSTIFGFAANDQTGERYINAKLLLEQVDQGIFEGYISDIVLREIENAPSWIKQKLKAEIIKNLLVLKEGKETDATAEEIIKRRIIPASYYGDALHVAMAVHGGLDVLVSYNYRHLVRIDVAIKIEKFTNERGFKRLRLSSPEEVIIYDR